MTPPKPPVLKMFPGLNPNLYKEDLEAHSGGKSLLSTEEQKASFQNARQKVLESTPQKLASNLSDTYRITTLGTGSAMPSKYRNGKLGSSPPVSALIALFSDIDLDTDA